MTAFSTKFRMDPNLDLCTRQPGESSRHFQRFEVFLYMGSTRTLTALVEKLAEQGDALHYDYVRQIARAHAWDRRVEAWDRIEARRRSTDRLLRVEKETDLQTRLTHQVGSRLMTAGLQDITANPDVMKTETKLALGLKAMEVYNRQTAPLQGAAGPAVEVNVSATAQAGAAAVSGVLGAEEVQAMTLEQRRDLLGRTVEEMQRRRAGAEPSGIYRMDRMDDEDGPR
ncbi:hypothetical protein ACH4TC_18475 [Streptomyces spororaveus]|uniref:hypothetical protein n=1 Tax=Streptomyces spororaveus TaxID=284039 RepID=UPI00378ACEC1